MLVPCLIVALGRLVVWDSKGALESKPPNAPNQQLTSS